MRTTSNFWLAFWLRFSSDKKKISFRNGFEIELNWSEFVIMRDILSRGYSVERLGNLLLFKKGNFKLIGPLPHVGVLTEDTDCFSTIDFQNKTVLDVGGFIGDTASLFSSLGAKKVIIYEPVSENHEFIKLNVQLNGINAEIHEEGIGETDGFTTIYFDNAGIDFGLKKTGNKERKIKIRNVSKIIEDSGAEIAKFDCEGAEISLVNVPKKIIRKIEYYIIEVHSIEIRNKLLRKFIECGFKPIKDLSSTAGPEYSVLFIQRTRNC
jgi:FkbM family methyltransferase